MVVFKKFINYPIELDIYNTITYVQNTTMHLLFTHVKKVQSRVEWDLVTDQVCNYQQKLHNTSIGMF